MFLLYHWVFLVWIAIWWHVPIASLGVSSVNRNLVTCSYCIMGCFQCESQSGDMFLLHHWVFLVWIAIWWHVPIASLGVSTVNRNLVTCSYCIIGCFYCESQSGDMFLLHHWVFLVWIAIWWHVPIASLGVSNVNRNLVTCSYCIIGCF
jgi:hypothetical protein